MFDFGWIGDLALGAAALRGLGKLRASVDKYMAGNELRHDEHGRRITGLEDSVYTVTLIAGEPTLVGFQAPTTGRK